MKKQGRTEKELTNDIAMLTRRVAELKISKKILKQTESELRHSEKNMRTIMQNIPDIIFTLNGEGTIITINRTVHGLTAKDTIGKNHLDYVTAESRPAIEKNVENAFTTGRVQNYETRGIGADGTEAWYETRVIPNKTQDKTPTVTVITRDITERKKAQQEREMLVAKLHRAEKMETVGILAGGVAHDLNNILTGLVSYPDLLLMEVDEDSPLRESILTIKQSGLRAAAVVQDLLTLARSGFAPTEALNLNETICEYFTSLQHKRILADNPHIQFENNLEAASHSIIGSAVNLSKCVANLVSNAVESMADSGKITTSTRNQHIDKRMKGYETVEEGDYVVFSVTDSGRGISAEDLQRVFEPFYTKKMVRRRPGTGLGLAVVWGTVKDHKGYIDVKSVEGQGTTFELYFPATRDEAAKKEAMIAIEKYLGNGEKILVVDDVGEQRDIACAMLSKLGYSATKVSSGEEAVEYMKTNSVDMLILDMIMDPGIDGLETYKGVLELHPMQKAIITSGFSETDRVREAQRLGAGQYLKKPYDFEHLALAVRAELDK